MNFNNEQDDKRITKADPQHVILMHSPYDSGERATSFLQVATAFMKHWRALLCALVICLLLASYLAYKHSQLRFYSEIISVPTVAQVSGGKTVKSPLFPSQDLITAFKLQYATKWQADNVPYANSGFQISDTIEKATASIPAVQAPVGTVMLSVMAPLEGYGHVAALFNNSLLGMQAIVREKVAYWVKGVKHTIQQNKQTIASIHVNMIGLQGSLSNKTNSLSEAHILMLSKLQNNLLGSVNALNAQNWMLSSLDDKVQVVVPMVSQPVSNFKHTLSYLLGGMLLAFFLTLLWMGIVSVAKEP